MNHRALIVHVIALCWTIQTAPAQDATPGKTIGVEEAIVSLPAGQRPPNRYALVVGVGEYADDRIPDLPACVKDARGMFEVLTSKSSGMFPADNVTLLVDEQVTVRTIIESLDKLARRTGPDDLVIVFFSGHGAVDDRGRPYWIMHDTKIDSLRLLVSPKPTSPSCWEQSRPRASSPSSTPATPRQPQSSAPASP